MAVVIPSGIQDIRVRRALEEIARQLNKDDTSIEVQEADPASDDPGNEGDVIYASGSESIWVFDGTEWARASGANSGVTVLVLAYVEGTNPVWGALSGVLQSSPNFKNDADMKIGLAPHIYEGGDEVASSVYTASTTSYTWYKNGLELTSDDINETQDSDTGVDKRVLLINQDDVREGNVNEVFTCVIDY